MILKSNQVTLRSLAEILSRTVAFDLQSLDNKEKTVNLGQFHKTRKAVSFIRQCKRQALTSQISLGC